MAMLYNSGASVSGSSRDDPNGVTRGAVVQLTHQQLDYLRRVYRLCRAKPGGCANSRAIAIAIGATEDQRMDIEDALAQAGYITVGDRPGTVRITERGRTRALLDDHPMGQPKRARSSTRLRWRSLQRRT